MKLKLLTFAMLATVSANVLAADVINHKSPYCAVVENGQNTWKRTALRSKKNCTMT